MEIEACVQPKIYEDGVGFKPMTYLPSEMEEAARKLIGRPVCLNHNAPQPGDSDEALNKKILGNVKDAWVSYDKYDPILDTFVTTQEPQRIMAKMWISDEGEWGPSVIQAVEQGILKSVSLGIWHTKTFGENGEVIDIEKTPMEVSLCKEGDIPFSDIYNATRTDPFNPMNTMETEDIQLVSKPDSFGNVQEVFTQASNGQKIRTQMFISVSSADWKQLVGEPKKKEEMSEQKGNEGAKPVGNVNDLTGNTTPATSATSQQNEGQAPKNPMEERLAEIEKKLAASEAAKQKAEDELKANQIFDEHKSKFEEASKALEANMKRYDAKSSQYSVLGKRKALFDDMPNHKTDLLDENSRNELLEMADFAISTAPAEPAPAPSNGAGSNQGVRTNASGAQGQTGQMSALERDNIAGQLAAKKEQDNVMPAWKRRMYGNDAAAANSASVNTLVNPRGQQEQPDGQVQGEGQEQQEQLPQYVDGSPWNLFTALAAQTCGVQDKVTEDSFKQDLITVSSKEQFDALTGLPREAFCQRYADSVYERRGGLSRNEKGLQTGNSFYSKASHGTSNVDFGAGGLVSQEELNLHRIKSDKLSAHNNARDLKSWASLNDVGLQNPIDLFN